MSRILGVIPARYASTRFPGKPLIHIIGKSMIQRVYEQSVKAKCFYKVVVATDDERILNHVKEFGGNAVMTSINHQTGTDRCNEVLFYEDVKPDVVINIQGDEPYIEPEQLELVAALFNKSEVQIATLIKRLNNNYDLFNPSIIKVVKDVNNKALFFSRSAIPFNRSSPNQEWATKGIYFKHIGIYAYRSEILNKVSALKQSSLEVTESLEQLRWLENGYTIHVAETHHDSYSVDVPEDLERFEGREN